MQNSGSTCVVIEQLEIVFSDNSLFQLWLTAQTCACIINPATSSGSSDLQLFIPLRQSVYVMMHKTYAFCLFCRRRSKCCATASHRHMEPIMTAYMTTALDQNSAWQRSSCESSFPQLHISWISTNSLAVHTLFCDIHVHEQAWESNARVQLTQSAAFQRTTTPTTL